MYYNDRSSSNNSNIITTDLMYSIYNFLSAIYNYFSKIKNFYYLTIILQSRDSSCCNITLKKQEIERH